MKMCASNAYELMPRKFFAPFLVFFLLQTTNSFSDEKIFEVWRGEVSLDNFYCEEQSVQGIIFDGDVQLIYKESKLIIVCPEIRFRNDGKIIVSTDFEITAKRASGALIIHSINMHSQSALVASQRQTKSRNGSTGRDGQNARSAPRGILRRFPLDERVGANGTSGRCGSDGENGRHGAPGQDGLKGFSISVSLDWIEPESSITLRSIGSAGQHGQNGQAGGDGGDGGRGGEGGKGSDATHIFAPGRGGHGGNGGCAGSGGRGGHGGNGGDGGPGGDIKLSFTENSFKLANDIPVKIESIGGSSGIGGSGGVGGTSGKPGRPGRAGKGGLGYTREGLPPAKAGWSGKIGRPGANGMRGHSGSDGATGTMGTVVWGRGAQSRDDIIRRLLGED